MTNTTPNMDLVLPDVIMTTGPGYAYLINAAQYLIDSHDHSPGKGVKITPAGLNISSDLTFNNTNNITNIRTARLFNNTSFTYGANDKGILYELNGELWYTDASGNNVQITLNGALDLSSGIAALTIKDSNLIIENASDTTKQYSFSAANLTTGTFYTINLPAGMATTSTLVTAATTQTLTNKTLTSPIISSINTGIVTFTLPTTDGTNGQFLQTNGSGTLTFANSTIPAANIQSATSTGQTYTSASTTYQILSPTAARTDTMPASLTAGIAWTFYNTATSWADCVTLQTSGSNAICIVPPLGTVTIMPISATPTAAANWILTYRESEPVIYTPTVTGLGTVTGNSAFANLSKSNLIINGAATTGTVTSALISMTIPSALVISTSYLALNNTTSQGGVILGNFGVNSAGGTANSWVLANTATSTAQVYVGNYFSDTVNSGIVPGTGTNNAGNTRIVSYEYTVPVTL